MTQTRFNALPYKAARQWLRDQGHKISDNAKLSDLREIYELCHADADADTDTSEAPEAETAEFDDYDPFQDDEPTDAPAPAIEAKLPPTTTQNPAEMLATALQAMMQPQPAPLDEAHIIELIREHAQGPKPLSVQVAKLPKVDIAPQHHKFPLLLVCLANGVHVMLTGEAGSGKTTAAHQAATALNRQFFAQSFCATTSKADLQGYLNASGAYVETNFRRAYESGAVFCADEFDAGNPNTNAVINAALANGTAGFPDGMIERHPNFAVVAAANTYGKGASARYVGRNKLDAATLDRFATIQWDTDEALEASLIGIQQPQTPFDLGQGGIVEGPKWLEICRKARQKAEDIKAEIIISPRAVQAGARLSAAGVGKAHLAEMFIYRGCDALTREKLAPAIAA